MTPKANMNPEITERYPYGVPQTALDVEALAIQERFFGQRFSDETIEEVDTVLDACRAELPPPGLDPQTACPWA